MMKIKPHPTTGVDCIVEFDISRRLLRKCTLSNGYGLYYDLYGKIYYISPEAEKLPKTEWRGTIIDGDYYIYHKINDWPEEPDIHPAIIEMELREKEYEDE